MTSLRFLIYTLFISLFFAQVKKNDRKFEQLGSLLPTPNSYRNAAGAPGQNYWQQRADYLIQAEIDDKKQILNGSESVTYYNNSPDDLDYLWLQLDQNMRATKSNSYKVSESKLGKRHSKAFFDRLEGYPDYDGGHKIQFVKDVNGKKLHYIIHQTMMRIDLPKKLKSGERFQFSIDWHYKINDRNRMGGRGGFEFFDKKQDKTFNNNYLYTITQWFPRMAVYDDVNGWQNKQFLGRGEFALEFGNYDVKITVPSDFIVASTGELQNPKDVLTKTQRDRFEKAKSSKKPVQIVNLKEAKKNEKSRSSKKKTWHYKAENVRDFAFGASRKYVWDAMGVKMGDRTVMAMSYYLKESYGLYAKYSTEVVAHTLKNYSEFTFEYPYPVAISVEAANGMEYPMICFNYGRTEKDGSYSERTKYGMIGVIIHEVGHNYFPMIVSSDERQWTWMDEGLNTFLQYISESRWDRNYPHRRGPAWSIAPYMKGDKSNISPIMTNSENIYQFGNNAYGKPATALNILRESVMGRDLFDFAFKTYAKRWMFKHPEPADLFRTMEDASAFDLDWFWHGWFFTTDHVDIAIKKVRWADMEMNPEKIAKEKRADYKAKKKHVSQELNDRDGIHYVMKAKPYLNDFYNKWDRFEVTKDQRKAYKKLINSFSAEEKALYKKAYQLYEISFENIGGLVMPLIVQFIYEDGSSEIERIPAEIWKKNNKTVTKVFMKRKRVKQIVLDPKRETADTDETNNYFPEKMEKTRFEIFKQRTRAQRAARTKKKNPMQKAKNR